MKRYSLLALAAVAALAVGACGTTEEAGAPAAGATSEAAAGPVTVKDGRGKEITLPKPATRVVSLEWGETEILTSLGVTPVGSADNKGYAVWNTAAPLDPSVKDVGTRGEPSVDSVVALQPDLVVMEAERGAPIVAQLEKYVPVLVTIGSDAKRNLDRLREDVTMIATAVGKQTEGEKLLSDLDARIASAKTELGAATGKQFAMADGWKEGSTVSIRMFGQGALVSDLATAIGLQNAWTAAGDPQWGLGQTDVEGMKALDGKDLRFFYNASDGVDVFADGLKGNAIWDNLQFVKDGKVTKLPNGIWTFGGPKSCIQWIDAVVAAYKA
ncbi:iron-siderophore ABC transporter substrate-binding protein [Asanoa sp. WMMD1127]|uniref:ABC transporter substrate-binding protein n=1 Tax=Asanoa sp. WMMD1127 TaxID=3016107 RepID=UPI00241782F1|nr:iron-siderophore ABC transporter substrate-binding protein [Asanoa sp. WMMD1127]MDG4825945.1 iron-siderophore ABC transporter substrate-binding protein [Asanoa sp. WMMD1127]